MPKLSLMASDNSLIIFDFDGTLADTGTLILQVSNRLARETDRSDLTAEDVRYFREEGLNRFISRYKLPFWELPLLFYKGRKYFSEIADQAVLVPGIGDMISGLANNGLNMGIITSNNSDTVSGILKRSGIRDAFDFIRSERGVFGKHRLIHREASRSGIAPDKTFYIGDEVRDVEAARNAGVGFVGVAWGLNTPAALFRAGAPRVISKPEELPPLFI